MSILAVEVMAEMKLEHIVAGIGVSSDGVVVVVVNKGG